MNTSASESNNADFVADEDFEAAEDFFAWAPVQQWAALNSEVDESALAVLTFTMCHLNPLTGRFDANFGRMRVAERFGKSVDWVDKRFRGLIKAGALSKQHMYWIDANDRRAGAARSPERIDPDTGAKRAQAPNRWRVRMSPPGAAAYPGPVNIGEYYRPERVTKRVNAAGGAVAQRPPSDQAKHEKTAVRGGAAAQRRGGAAAQRPKQSRKGTTTERNPSYEGGNFSVRPLRDAHTRASEPASVDNRAERGEHLGRVDRRTDGKSSSTPQGPSPEPEHPHGAGTARSLVEADSVRADLARIDIQPDQRERLTAAVDNALLRFPADQVARYLELKAREARTVKFLLTAFEKYADAIKAVPRSGGGQRGGDVVAELERAAQEAEAARAARLAAERAERAEAERVDADRSAAERAEWRQEWQAATTTKEHRVAMRRLFRENQRRRKNGLPPVLSPEELESDSSPATA